MTYLSVQVPACLLGVLLSAISFVVLNFYTLFSVLPVYIQTASLLCLTTLTQGALGTYLVSSESVSSVSIHHCLSTTIFIKLFFILLRLAIKLLLPHHNVINVKISGRSASHFCYKYHFRRPGNS